MGAANRTAAGFADQLAKLAFRFVPAYAERLHACVVLLAQSEALVKEQHSDRAHGYENGDVLIWGTGARTIKTFRAALYLAAVGHGPQAVVLCRTLIEDALTVAWIDANRDEALRLMDLHERHNRHLSATLFEQRRLDLGALADLPPVDPEELSEMASVFGTYGQWSWTGHKGLRSLYEAVRDGWEPETERDLLDHVIEVDLRYANQRTHNTALSLARPQDIGTTQLYDAGESLEDVAPALLLAFWAFGHTTKHLLRDPYRDQFMAVYYAHMPSFFAP